VAGFIATADDWLKFEKDWNVILQIFGVSALHMKHFAHSRGEYESWKGNTGRRRQFLARLIEVIRKRTKRNFASCVVMKDYRDIDSRYCLSERYKPLRTSGRNLHRKG